MKDSLQSIIDTEVPVLIDFYADWCGPCKTLFPILKMVKEELGDTVKIIKINVEKNQYISHKFKIKGVPTLLIFKNKKQVWRQSGVPSKEELIQTISSIN